MKSNFYTYLPFPFVITLMTVILHVQQGSGLEVLSKSLLLMSIFIVFIIATKSTSLKLLITTLYVLGIVLESVFFSRLKTPVGVEHIHGILADPINSINMIGDQTIHITNTSIALIILALIALIVTARLSLKQRNHPVAIVMIGLGCTVIYSGAASSESSNPLFKHITYLTTHYGMRTAISVTERVVPEQPIVGHSQPNIILLVSESISNEMISGNRNVMPYLNGFIDLHQMTQFSNCISNGTYTGLSVVHMYFGKDSKSVYTTQTPSLFSYAKNAGYQTYYVNSRNSKWHRIDDLLSQDIDYFFDITDPRTKGLCATQHCGLLEGVSDREVYSIVSKDNLFSSVPFFFAWHMDAAHPPYDRFKEGDLNGVPAAMRRLDDILRIIEEASPPNTVLILTSDHGHEHNIDTVDVPLYIKGPHLLSGYNSNSNLHDLPVSHHDLFNTLIETFGYRDSVSPGTGLFLDHEQGRVRYVEVSRGVNHYVQ